MTTLREAAQQALEALEWFNKYGSEEHGPSLRGAEGHLRAALAEPVQEPVSLETIYETIIKWDEGGGKRSRRELARRITALRAALAEPPTNQCGETCERAKLCAVCVRGLADGDKVAPTEPVQEPLTIERLRDALVASRIIQPAAVEDPDEYDDGVTLFRIEALHRRIT